MKCNVISVTDRVLAEHSDDGVRPYLDAFNIDCSVRNLTQKTIDVYFEWLGYLLHSTREQSIAFTDTSKRVIQDYIVSLKGQVSDETINGRIRAYRRFFNFLVAEGLWQKENPMASIRLLKTASRVKPVVDPETTVQRIVRSLKRSTFEGSHNLAMVLLFWDGMLRNKEIRNLRLTDIDIQSRLMKVPGQRGKSPMLFTLESGEPFAFAGLWDCWRDPEGKQIHTYTINTTEANDLGRPIHNRMPVILKPRVEDQWIDPDNKDVEHLSRWLVPYESKLMKVHEVSRRVNSPSNNSPDCIRPIETDS